MDVRTAAAKVIGQLLQQQGSLASLIPDYSQKVDDQDRALLQELCYGSARWFPQLNCILDCLLEKPLRKKDSDVVGLLIIGLYQLIYLRVPDHAALNTTVTAANKLKKSWAKGLVNAVLRRFLRERSNLEASLQNNPAYITAHPVWLIDTIKNHWPAQAEDIFTANNQRPLLTLRVNQQQISRDEYLTRLADNNISAKPTSFSTDGITVDTPLAVDALPLFVDGGFSVQDEAPQLAATLMDLQPGHSVLDACAAPGGKTAHILETQPQLQKLIALDVSAKRLTRVEENLTRLQLNTGATHIHLKTGDASAPNSWWDGDLFDCILIDAPCSATGIIRRQPDIKILRTPENVAKLVAIQSQVLTALWPLLKPGGILVYATCSILPVENCEQIAQFVAAHDDAEHQPIDRNWGIAQTFGRQLLPQREGHDGFYYAVLRKVV